MSDKCRYCREPIQWSQTEWSTWPLVTATETTCHQCDQVDRSQGHRPFCCLSCGSRGFVRDRRGWMSSIGDRLPLLGLSGGMRRLIGIDDYCPTCHQRREDAIAKGLCVECDSRLDGRSKSLCSSCERPNLDGAASSRCLTCGEPINQGFSLGRAAKFCSNKCRQKEYNLRSGRTSADGNPHKYTRRP